MSIFSVSIVEEDGSICTEDKFFKKLFNPSTESQKIFIDDVVVSIQEFLKKLPDGKLYPFDKDGNVDERELFFVALSVGILTNCEASEEQTLSLYKKLNDFLSEGNHVCRDEIFLIQACLPCSDLSSWTDILSILQHDINKWEFITGLYTDNIRLCEFSFPLSPEKINEMLIYAEKLQCETSCNLYAISRTIVLINALVNRKASEVLKNFMQNFSKLHGVPYKIFVQLVDIDGSIKSLSKAQKNLQKILYLDFDNFYNFYQIGIRFKELENDTINDLIEASEAISEENKKKFADDLIDLIQFQKNYESIKQFNKKPEPEKETVVEKSETVLPESESKPTKEEDQLKLTFEYLESSEKARSELINEVLRCLHHYCINISREEIRQLNDKMLLVTVEYFKTKYPSKKSPFTIFPALDELFFACAQKTIAGQDRENAQDPEDLRKTLQKCVHDFFAPLIEYRGFLGFFQKICDILIAFLTRIKFLKQKEFVEVFTQNVKKKKRIFKGGLTTEGKLELREEEEELFRKGNVDLTAMKEKLEKLKQYEEDVPHKVM